MDLFAGNAAGSTSFEPGEDAGETWHSCGMPRVRVSTTVDEGLLAEVRGRHDGVNDAQLLDAALVALLERDRAAEIDASYEAYDRHPIDEPDEWGDLASFHEAARRS